MDEHGSDKMQERRKKVRPKFTKVKPPLTDGGKLAVPTQHPAVVRLRRCHKTD